jgi:hypothetical protein
MNGATSEAKGIRIVAIVGIAAVLLFIGGIMAAYHLLIEAPAKLAHATADGFRSLFQVTPRVTVNETVIIEQTSPILEVATVSRPLMVDHEWSHTWLGSTKILRVRGTFTAKAGYDLKKPFEIDITPSPLSVKASLPDPEILSLQMDSFVILLDENGWWNRLTEEDRSNAVTTLQSIARSKAESSGILGEVRRSAEERIREMVERNGALVAFTSAKSPE